MQPSLVRSLLELFFNKGGFSAFSVLDWVGVKRKRQDGDRERMCEAGGSRKEGLGNKLDKGVTQD